MYRVLEDLARRRLVERLAVDGPATWASPGVDEVLERLHVDQQQRLVAERAEQEDRLAALHAEQERRLLDLKENYDVRIQELAERVAGARDLLAEVAAEPAGPLPRVQLIPSAAQLDKVYDDLLAEVRSELLVLVRPPYAHALGSVKTSIIDALSRGVRARAIYEASQLSGPEADGFRRETSAYHEAGVDARVVDHIPIKMAIFDRTVTLVALVEPAPDRIAYPTFLLVDHAGFAAYQAEAFDQRWAEARPAPPPHGEVADG